MRFLGFLAQTSILVIVGLIVVMLLLGRFTDLISARPDRNIEYAISVRVPDGRSLVFTGVTGCEHAATGDGGRYRTFNHTAILADGAQTWLLEGINCDQALRTRGTYEYAVYALESDITARKYFIGPGASARIEGGTFDSTIFGALNTTPPHRSYHHGPYFYRSFSLASVPEFAANLAAPVVIFDGSHACGTRNAPERRLALSDEQRAELEAAYTRYVPGHLEFSEAADGWRLGAPMAVDAGFSVAHKETDPECLVVDYSGTHYVLSAFNAGVMLYLPDTNTVIRADELRASDLQLALRRSGEWQPCAATPGLALPEPGEIRIDRSEDKSGMLVKNAAGAAVCIRNSDYQWL